MGLQIAYLALFAPIVPYLISLGVIVAGKGFEPANRSIKAYDVLILAIGGTIAFSGAFLLPMFCYWIVFESGIYWLLR